MLSTIEIGAAPPGTRAEALEASGIKGVTRLASRRLRWLGRFSESRSGASRRSRRIANPPQVNNLPHRNSPQRATTARSEEHTSELQSLRHLVCRLLLE